MSSMPSIQGRKGLTRCSANSLVDKRILYCIEKSICWSLHPRDGLAENIDLWYFEVCRALQNWLVTISLLKALLRSPCFPNCFWFFLVYRPILILHPWPFAMGHCKDAAFVFSQIPLSALQWFSSTTSGQAGAVVVMQCSSYRKWWGCINITGTQNK